MSRGLLLVGLALAGPAGCHGNRSLVAAGGSPDAAAAGSADAATVFLFPDSPPEPDQRPGPDAEGPLCWRFSQQPFVVCFGDDPTPYQLYLWPPRDGGYPAGQCPRASDFAPSPQGESCLWVGCGPAAPSALSRLDAGPVTGDGGGPPCCFWVAQACGF